MYLKIAWCQLVGRLFLVQSIRLYLGCFALFVPRSLIDSYFDDDLYYQGCTQEYLYSSHRTRMILHSKRLTSFKHSTVNTLPNTNLCEKVICFTSFQEMFYFFDCSLWNDEERNCHTQSPLISFII